MHAVCVLKANRSTPGLSEAGGSEERDASRRLRSWLAGAVVAACKEHCPVGIGPADTGDPSSLSQAPQTGKVWPRARDAAKPSGGS